MKKRNSDAGGSRDSDLRIKAECAELMSLNLALKTPGSHWRKGAWQEQRVWGLPASLLSSFYTLLARMRHIKEKDSHGGVEGRGGAGALWQWSE